ncbi:hypothetical protein GGR54DRAFT_48446 [Hypoxylon sp. NC1633]|nr:hypothetical protein GGR54DRAFT_48446 [Hypoxylon sp. NC1633]
MVRKSCNQDVISKLIGITDITYYVRPTIPLGPRGATTFSIHYHIVLFCANLSGVFHILLFFLFFFPPSPVLFWGVGSSCCGGRLGKGGSRSMYCIVLVPANPYTMVENACIDGWKAFCRSMYAFRRDTTCTYLPTCYLTSHPHARMHTDTLYTHTHTMVALSFSHQPSICKLAKLGSLGYAVHGTTGLWILGRGMYVCM